MRFHIRPYTPADSDWVLAAEAALQAHEIEIFDRRLALTLRSPQPSAAAYLDMLWPVLAENHGAMLIGCDEHGRRLGLVAGHVVDEPFPTETPDCTRYGYVSDIYIMPEARGSGLAGQLLDAIAAHLHAVDATLTRLRINVLAANGVARAAYERAGFVPYEIMYERKLG
jgi:GNAT superfamily N-acetyltransferase